MTATEPGLDSLQLTLSRASKTLVASGAFFLAAALISFGASPEKVNPPGLPFPVPAHTARLIFAICGAGSVWLSWAWLRQALSLLHRLEFQHELDPERIRSTLVGSSLISASPVMAKGICYLCVLLVPFAVAPAFTERTFVHGLVSLLLGGPYLLLVVDQRLRFLNPNKWSKLPFPFTLFFWMEPALQNYHREVIAEGFSRMMRRFGPIKTMFVAIFSYGFVDLMVVEGLVIRLPSEFSEEDFKEKSSMAYRGPKTLNEYYRSSLAERLIDSGLVEVIKQKKIVRFRKKSWEG